MKYSGSITINLPIEKVIATFDNQENIFKWMEGLESFDHISGTPGEVGAKSKLVFKTKKRVMEMEEEITKKSFPEHFNFLYTSKEVKNWNDNHFESIDENTTKWTQSNVFRCKGAIWLFALLMPGMFKKQSMKYMEDFKRFAENEANH
jgi:uncharacterized membrane protein